MLFRSVSQSRYGGAAFVLVYIVASLLLSLPIFLSEAVIGRSSRSNAFGAMKTLAPKSHFWQLLGYLFILTPMIVESYYSVVGGWSLDYLYKSCTLAFVNADPQSVSNTFGSFLSSPWQPILFHLLFLSISISDIVTGKQIGRAHV